MTFTSTWYNKKSGKIIETVAIAGFDGLSLGECRSEVDDLIDEHGSEAVVKTQTTSDGEQSTYISFEREEHSNETIARIARDNQNKEDNKAYKIATYNKLKEELGL